jgi:hypothetical protein
VLGLSQNDLFRWFSDMDIEAEEHGRCCLSPQECDTGMIQPDKHVYWLKGGLRVTCSPLKTKIRRKINGEQSIGASRTKRSCIL